VPWSRRCARCLSNSTTFLWADWFLPVRILLPSSTEIVSMCTLWMWWLLILPKNAPLRSRVSLPMMSPFLRPSLSRLVRQLKALLLCIPWLRGRPLWSWRAKRKLIRMQNPKLKLWDFNIRCLPLRRLFQPCLKTKRFPRERCSVWKCLELTTNQRLHSLLQWTMSRLAF